MRFSIFLPPGAASSRLPALFYLAGLTCTEETFMTKAGAQRVAASLGVILIAPDTSPRNAGVEGESDNWDLGVGAGFYVDATEPDEIEAGRRRVPPNAASHCRHGGDVGRARQRPNWRGGLLHWETVAGRQSVPHGKRALLHLGILGEIVLGKVSLLPGPACSSVPWPMA